MPDTPPLSALPEHLRRPVTVYRLVAENTVEEKILALHAEKGALAAEFLEGADTAVAPSEEELLQLLT